MKKILAMLLALMMVLPFVGCAGEETPATTDAVETEETAEVTATEEATADATEEAEPVKVDYAGYVAAEIDTKLIVEAYVQATQAWWDGKITVYAADQDGAYFIYEMACTEDEAKLLTPGVKIRVTGVKGEWSGEVEIMDATFVIVDEADTYVAEVFDATELLGTDDLIKHQNEKAAFKGLTIKKIAYKNDQPGDGNDIYVTVTKGEADYDFCVEAYLTDPDTDVYKAFAELKEGDVIDVEGFIYWYNGVNTHITSVVKAAA